MSLLPSKVYLRIRRTFIPKLFTRNLIITVDRVGKKCIIGRASDSSDILALRDKEKTLSKESMCVTALVTKRLDKI